MTALQDDDNRTSLAPTKMANMAAQKQTRSSKDNLWTAYNMLYLGSTTTADSQK